MFVAFASNEMQTITTVKKRSKAAAEDKLK